MAEDRFRFRCYRCNQLLAVPYKRRGSTISCPRCRAELEVPRAVVEPAAASATPGRRETGRPAEVGDRPREEERSVAPPPPRSLFEEIAAAIPDDLAALRPEDLRVEAEFADLVIDTRGPEARGIAASPGASDERPPTSSEDSPAYEGPSVAEAIAMAQVAELGSDAVIPPIAIEPATILPSSHDSRPVREVVLQPATVLAWSLLVLMSIPMAFTAGLLIGHFVWK
ncbi:MAG: hypothetical protein U0790_15370 [Isosphaeraceae bacterium]